MSTLYFLRQPFTNDPKDTWRIASGRAFDLMPEADRMAVVSAADLAAAQQEIARLRGALGVLRTALEKIADAETTVFDEDEQQELTVAMDEDEMASVARLALETAL